MNRRSALLSHLLALHDLVWRAQRRQALYLTSSVKPARMTGENDFEQRGFPFVAATFRHHGHELIGMVTGGAA